MRQHLARELQLAKAQRAAVALADDPAQIEADHLPHGIEAEAARQHRIVLEMAAEKPKIRLHIPFGADQALAVVAAGIRTIAAEVEPRHRLRRLVSVARHENVA